MGVWDAERDQWVHAPGDNIAGAGKLMVFSDLGNSMVRKWVPMAVPDNVTYQNVSAWLEGFDTRRVGESYLVLSVTAEKYYDLRLEPPIEQGVVVKLIPSETP